jgi:pilus assembly protein CpaF
MSLLAGVSRSAREKLVAGTTESPNHAVLQVLDEFAAYGQSLQSEPQIHASALNKLQGFGVLQPFIDDKSIEEIWINRPNQIFVAKSGGVQVIDLELDAEELRTLIFRMLRASGRRLDRTMPFVDAALPDGSRLHVVIPEVTAAHWSVNIRKFPSGIITLDQLVAWNSLSQQKADYLSAAVRSGKNILIAGATHSGKTTLLCALLHELQNDIRLVTCEETFEIRSELQDWVAMQTRQPNLEGQGEIPLRRLVKEALRMRPSYLVIGEVREAESLDLLIGMNSGIPGMCTIHANSAQASLVKLCTLPLLAGPNISSDFVRATAVQAIDLVVQCSNSSERGRWISEIAIVTEGIDGNPHATQVVFDAPSSSEVRL